MIPRKHKRPPAYMLTGTYFYAPVRAWIASGSFRHFATPPRVPAQ